MPKSDFWDKLKTRLIEVSNAAADFTEEQAVVGKLKFDILNLNRKIDRNKHDIGDIVLQIHRTDAPYNPLNDEEVRKRIAYIGDLEVQIAAKRAEITRDVDEIRSRRKPHSKPVASSAPRPAPHPAPPPAAKPAPKKPVPATAKPAAPATVKKPLAKKPAAKTEKKPG